MLQEDALRFDAFLKENDKKAHDALKRYAYSHTAWGNQGLRVRNAENSPVAV